VRVYYFTKAKWALQAIHTKRLKISRFFEMNDPFELLAVDQRDPVGRKRMRDWSATINKEQGVICFTDSWQDPLMWSHYGDRHNGVCLGFDACDLQRINYKPERLTPILCREHTSHPPEELTRLLLTTKFSRWEYEKERRVLPRLSEMTKRGELYFKPFDDRLRLVEVIAGSRCCIGWRHPLADAVSGLPQKPKLVKARLSFRKFKVVTQLEQGCASWGYEADFHWQKCRCQVKDHDPNEIRKLLSA
jgi:hypothetical protein